MNGPDRCSRTGDDEIREQPRAWRAAQSRRNVAQTHAPPRVPMSTPRPMRRTAIAEPARATSAIANIAARRSFARATSPSAVRSPHRRARATSRPARGPAACRRTCCEREPAPRAPSRIPSRVCGHAGGPVQRRGAEHDRGVRAADECDDDQRRERERLHRHATDHPTARKLETRAIARGTQELEDPAGEQRYRRDETGEHRRHADREPERRQIDFGDAGHHAVASAVCEAEPEIAPDPSRWFHALHS